MPTLNEFVLEVDFSGNGTFEAIEDLTADVLACQHKRGRDSNSQITGRVSAGTLQATLLNIDGKYSRFNSSSPFFGQLLPRRKVRVRSTAPTAATLWTGYLHDLIPQPGPVPTAVLSAVGPFSLLSGPNAKISTQAYANIKTGQAVGYALDAISWPAGDRSIQTGEIPLPAWGVEGQEVLAAMREMEDTEIGLLLEGTAWDVQFKGRYDREINHGTSVATFSDAVAASLPYMGISESDPLLDVFNRVVITVGPLHGHGEFILWTFVGAVSLAAGQSVTYIAVAPPTHEGETLRLVDWVTPVVGTDIVQVGVSNGDIGVSTVETVKSLQMTITNNHATSGCTLTLVQARGVPTNQHDLFQVVQQDATSIASYLRREYPFPSNWFFGSPYAIAAAKMLVALYKDPKPQPTLILSPSTNDSVFAQAVQRDISDRITLVATGLLTELGINGDFYIESIQHSWGAKQPLITTWLLSQAPAVSDWWILGVDQLGVGTKVAY